MVNPDTLELHRLIEAEKWVKVAQRASSDPDEAAHVNPETKLTALHLAIRAKRAGDTRIAAIRALLQAYPDAATTCDGKYGYTPLMYAIQMSEGSLKALDEDQQVVELILQFAPKSLLVVCRNGLSPLNMHIMALSQVKKDMITRRSKKVKAQGWFSILKVILSHKESMPSVAKSLDVLFECNSFEVLEQVALEEAHSTTAKLRARRQVRSSGVSAANGSTSTTTLTAFWVWECAVLLLQAEHFHKRSKSKPAPSFNVIHAAAQVKDCPLPFLILAMRASPQQVRSADELTGNLPLHGVAGWDITDAASVSRKAMALSVLVSEYPQASKIRNKVGKTPLSLALQTGTTWDNGVRRLTSLQRENSSSSRTARSHR